MVPEWVQWKTERMHVELKAIECIDSFIPSNNTTGGKERESQTAWAHTHTHTHTHTVT
jgi:hypothetical protein